MDALQIILPKGDSNGIKIIDQLTGWNGKCFIVPRTELKSLKDRPEMKASGLYFLFGEDEETGKQLVYIGESRDCLSRLTSHDAEKDFWNEAAVFLDPPDRNYLESIATKFAKEAERFVVKNSNQPFEEAQTEFDRIKNEKYFEEARKVLSVFGYKLFEKVSDSYLDNKIYHIQSSDGAEAKAKVLDNSQMIVFKGSLARVRETEAFTGWAFAARRQFIKEGKLKILNDKPESYEFVEDIIFNTPSAAAATVKGAPINGWTTWKDEQGNTLNDNLRK